MLSVFKSTLTGLLNPDQVRNQGGAVGCRAAPRCWCLHLLLPRRQTALFLERQLLIARCCCAGETLTPGHHTRHPHQHMPPTILRLPGGQGAGCGAEAGALQGDDGRNQCSGQARRKGGRRRGRRRRRGWPQGRAQLLPGGCWGQQEHAACSRCRCCCSSLQLSEAVL